MSSHNYAIICLLIASFGQKMTDVPFLLYYIRWGVSIQQSYTLCTIWNWLDYALITGPLHILAWFCIERHLFVFDSQMMKKKWCLIIFHYEPLIICLIYAPLFYLVVLVFPSKCTNISSDCIFCKSFSFVSYQMAKKNSQRRSIEWRRQKWMVIQLVFISTLCLILDSPAVIVRAIRCLWLPTFAIDIQINYIAYFINQFLPFVIVSSLPESNKNFYNNHRDYFYYDHDKWNNMLHGC
jgi:hypothetical protein